MRLIIDIARLVSKLLTAFRALIYTHIIHKVILFTLKYIPAPLIGALKPLSPIFTNGITYIKNIQAIVGTLLLFNLADLSSLLNPFELLNVLNNYAAVIKTMLYNFSDKYLNIQIDVPQDKPIAKVKIDVKTPKVDYSKMSFDQIPPRPKSDEPLFSLRDDYKNIEIKDPSFMDKYGTYIAYGLAGIIIIGGIVYFCYTWNIFGGKPSEPNINNSGPKGINYGGDGGTISDGISDAGSRESVQERLRRLAKGKGRANEIIFDADAEATLPNSPTLSQKERIGLDPVEGSYRSAMDKYFPESPYVHGSEVSTPASSEMMEGVAPTPQQVDVINETNAIAGDEGLIARVTSWFSSSKDTVLPREADTNIDDALTNNWVNEHSPNDGARTPTSAHGDNYIPEAKTPTSTTGENISRTPSGD